MVHTAMAVISKIWQGRVSEFIINAISSIRNSTLEEHDYDTNFEHHSGIDVLAVQQSCHVTAPITRLATISVSIPISSADLTH